MAAKTRRPRRALKVMKLPAVTHEMLKLARPLWSLTPPHFRHLRRHLLPVHTHTLAHLVDQKFDDLTRRSMSLSAAWEFLPQEENPVMLSGDMKLEFVTEVHAAAKWLAEAGEVSMTDTDGAEIGGDRGLYTWPDDELPDPQAELVFYFERGRNGSAFATFVTAQIFTRDEDGRALPDEAAEYAAYAGNEAETRQRARYLMADLTSGAGPVSDRAEAFFWAYSAYLNDPAGARALGRDKDHLCYWNELTAEDSPALEDLLGDGASDAMRRVYCETEDGRKVFINRDEEAETEAESEPEETPAEDDLPTLREIKANIRRILSDKD
ncbi:MAG: hypothetical protein O6850_03960 [Acidobacteria bacterium]|nr:hypothetical protein [Acidobacteriota bacterium]